MHRFCEPADGSACASRQPAATGIPGIEWADGAVALAAFFFA
jgi:hypothetical protein